MNKLNWWKTVFSVCALCAATAIASPAQSFKSLVRFNQYDGSLPYYMSLVQGPDGNLYGTTLSGGAHGWGTVFKLTPSGVLSTLYSFCARPGCPDGSGPSAGLALGADGNFYGTATFGGAYGGGTVFKITPAGAFTTLHSFHYSVDGQEPLDALVQGSDGNFYGTTYAFGPNNWGTVFKITPQGTLTTLYSFCVQANCADGSTPVGGLVEGSDGNFYGTTLLGGGGGSCSSGEGCGTVFKITPEGTLTTLYKFGSYPDGADPYAALIQGGDGNFYGTTAGGGAGGAGTVFEITPEGALTTLHSFGVSDGAGPIAGLVQATDGNFYGTTDGGGSGNPGFGTVFSITPEGILTTLHQFHLPDGSYPYGGLVQATSGTFSGATTYGGFRRLCGYDYGCGTLFDLSTGLGPFVETLPTAGSVGKSVMILGTDLTGATSVTFNNTPATFTVVSATEITATVPTGVTTGTVQVVTPSGTLSSNVMFRVRQ